jgi:hypothetical protein
LIMPPEMMYKQYSAKVIFRSGMYSAGRTSQMWRLKEKCSVAIVLVR